MLLCKRSYQLRVVDPEWYLTLMRSETKHIRRSRGSRAPTTYIKYKVVGSIVDRFSSIWNVKKNSTEELGLMVSQIMYATR